ncbi:MAG: gamma-glutamylcyclotransferase, partial [Anaerolineales bacterium]|nr:gamma-glutamylcyclotransferase [Anaerolineales bacterium]
MDKDLFVFAYGTLRPGRGGSPPEDSRYYGQIQAYLQEARPAELKQANLYDMGSYPAARPGEAQIIGDLLQLDRAALEVIDRIEGHPVFYRRELVTVHCDGRGVEAWVYWAPKGLEQAGVPIPSGDWFARAEFNTARAGQALAAEGAAVQVAQPDPTLVSQLERLAEAEAIWLTTVRPDGRPHSTPVWHGWHHGRIYVVAKPESVKISNLQNNSGVVVTLPDPINTLVIEGFATIVPTMRKTIRPIFKKKYDWDIETDREYRAVIEITPYKVLAWGSESEGRWTGAEIFL